MPAHQHKTGKIAGQSDRAQRRLQRRHLLAQRESKLGVFIRCHFVNRHVSSDSGSQDVSELLAVLAIPTREKRPTEQLHAEQPSQRLDCDIRCQHVRFQIVNQLVDCMKERLSGFVFGEKFVLIAAGQFEYSVPGLSDRGILLG